MRLTTEQINAFDAASERFSEAELAWAEVAAVDSLGEAHKIPVRGGNPYRTEVGSRFASLSDADAKRLGKKLMGTPFPGQHVGVARNGNVVFGTVKSHSKTGVHVRGEDGRDLGEVPRSDVHVAAPRGKTIPVAQRAKITQAAARQSSHLRQVVPPKAKPAPKKAEAPTRSEPRDTHDRPEYRGNAPKLPMHDPRPGDPPSRGEKAKAIGEKVAKDRLPKLARDKAGEPKASKASRVAQGTIVVQANQQYLARLLQGRDVKITGSGDRSQVSGISAKELDALIKADQAKQKRIEGNMVTAHRRNQLGLND